MSLFQSLPTELLDIICKQLDHGDLARLSLVAKHFVAPAQDRLYRSFPGSRRNARSFCSFLLTLAQRPDLASLVTTMDLCSIADFSQNAETDGYLRPYLDLDVENVPELNDAEIEYAPRHLDVDMELFAQLNDAKIDARLCPYADFEHECLPRLIPALEEVRRDRGALDTFSDGSSYTQSFYEYVRSIKSTNRRIIPFIFANWLLKLAQNVESVRLDPDWCPPRDDEGGHLKWLHSVDMIGIQKSPGQALRRLRTVEVVGRPKITRQGFSMSQHRYVQWKPMTLNRFNSSMDEAREARGLITREPLHMDDVLELSALKELQLGNELGNLTWRYPKRIEVSSLILTNYLIDNGHGIRQLIQACIRLEIFECHGVTKSNEGPTAAVLASGVINALSQHKMSLCRLHISLGDSANPFMIIDANDGTEDWGTYRSTRILKQFSGLKDIRLDLGMINFTGARQMSGWDNIKRISEVLPQGVEKLVLGGIPGENDPAAIRDEGFVPSRMVVELAKDLPTTCPNLCSIDIRMAMVHGDNPPFEDWIRRFAEVDCELRVHEWTPPYAWYYGDNSLSEEE